MWYRYKLFVAYCTQMAYAIAIFSLSLLSRIASLVYACLATISFIKESKYLIDADDIENGNFVDGKNGWYYTTILFAGMGIDSLIQGILYTIKIRLEKTQPVKDILQLIAHYLMTLAYGTCVFFAWIAYSTIYNDHLYHCEQSTECAVTRTVIYKMVYAKMLITDTSDEYVLNNINNNFLNLSFADINMCPTSHEPL